MGIQIPPVTTACLIISSWNTGERMQSLQQKIKFSTRRVDEFVASFAAKYGGAMVSSTILIERDLAGIARMAAIVQTCVPPLERGRKKRLPPPTAEDRRNYHRMRLDNYHRSAARATSADRLMLQVLIDLTAPLSESSNPALLQR